MEANSIRRRVKKKFICPNPLFVQWLTEWKQDAAEKGLKIQYTYAKALSSLKKYPLPLSSGKEAKILEYFGDKICSMLDKKLDDFKSSGSSSSSKHSSPTKLTIAARGPARSNSSSPKPKKIAAASTLRTISPGILKTVSIGRVQRAIVPNHTEIKTAMPSIDDESNKFYLYPGHYSVLLCVDNCETTSSGQGKQRMLFAAELKKCGVEFEVRKLHIGDFLWVARDNVDHSKELVLDFIVERKRFDDLAHSIKDGRFREQKFRMKNSGLKCPVYLVENCSGAKYLGLPESTLEQAIVNTQVIDNFLVKRTQGTRESVTYLSSMTKMLRSRYQNQTLSSGSQEAVKRKDSSSNIFLPFKEFNRSSVKNKSLTVKEMFGKHLIQFFGLSVDRAAAIVGHFQTLPEFLEAYDECGSEAEKIQMVASIKYGIHKKNIGQAIGKSLLQFYGT